MTWLIVIVRLAGTTSRHRVAVWRELRRAGAAPVAQGVWTVPDTPYFAAAIQKASALAVRGEGVLLVLSASAENAPSEESLKEAFRNQRLEEWAEFSSDCGKFEAEIAKEIHIKKFTLAELEEEEQSLERLRRWYRDLKSRDVLTLPEAAAAGQRLTECTARLEEYAQMVYARLHTKDREDPDSTVSSVAQ